jgi:lipopolysaccharide export system permease protein
MVMVMGQAYKLVGLIIDKGVSPIDIVILLVTLLPTFFAISLPLAFLMGIMIGLGRMSADSETVALKNPGDTERLKPKVSKLPCRKPP